MKDAPSNFTWGKGIPLGGLSRVMGTIAVLIALLLLGAVYRTASGYRELYTAKDNYLKWQGSVGEMQAATEYLADQVRYYAATGSRTYLDRYCEEYGVTCRREAALAAIREDLDGTDACADFELAMQRSQNLCARDLYAMHLIAAAYGYDMERLPVHVREVRLLSEDEALSPADKMEHGRGILLDEQYTERGDAINTAIKQCYIDLASETEARQSKAAAQMSELLMTQHILIVAAISIVLLLLLLISLTAITPLVRGVSHIRNEQAIPVTGAAEFRFLAQAYNAMFEANRQKTESLEYEANHDKLTGLYNRAGYEYLIQTTDMSSSALLLIDVDRFKDVNDTYGHDMGDRVLKRIADALRESFRTGDYICRIGGDEFATIMLRCEMKHRELIRGKIEHINDSLRHPADDLPPASVSVGVAFGCNANSTGSIAKDADLALYQVKENGRCGVAFYEGQNDSEAEGNDSP